jgi:hypothetical protein
MLRSLVGMKTPTIFTSCFIIGSASEVIISAESLFVEKTPPASAITKIVWSSPRKVELSENSKTSPSTR